MVTSAEKEAYKKWYARNKKKVSIYQHERYLEHRDEIIEQNRRYRKNNKEKVARYNRLWKQRNRDKVIGYARKRKAERESLK